MSICLFIFFICQTFIYASTHLLNKYLLRAYYGPQTVTLQKKFSSKHKQTNKQTKNYCSYSLQMEETSKLMYNLLG